MTTKKTVALHYRLAGLALLGVAVLASPQESRAQEAAVFHACYVPSSGTVYRIREPDLRQTCGTTQKDGQTEQHVAFSWSAMAAMPEASAANGGGKPIDHGTLIGLSDDDHPQYVPVNGVRNANSGFALTGTVGGPSPMPNLSTGFQPLPALLWHAGKGAFRAGGIGEFTSLGSGHEWTDAYIGEFSIGLGPATLASGSYSFAGGVGASASGEGSVALGRSTRASGIFSAALGPAAIASANMAIALGGRASGDLSVAIGQGANTNGKRGAIVISPAVVGQTDAFAQADRQFVARASSFWFGNTDAVTATAGRLIETSSGAYLSSGGAWVSVSDAGKKTAFEEIDGEEVLAKIAALPIRTWSYKAEGTAVRHMGPTAQDFNAAFGLGDTKTAIAGIDADGVSLAALQALEKRTASLATLARLVEQQENRIRELEAIIATMR